MSPPFKFAPPVPRAAQQIFPDHAKIDLDVAPLGWTLAFLQTKANQTPLPNNALANYAGGRGTSGEAGILSRIFDIAGATNKWCCEFGAGDGDRASNTYELVHDHGWSTVYIEPDSAKFERLAANFRDRDNVHTRKQFIAFDPPNTIDGILATTPCPKDLDLMVIDIDGADYHIWDSIRDYRARVVMIEFNSTIPPDVSHIPPRDMTIRQGTSLLALCELAATKGYELVAVTSWNAIFVERHMFAKFGIADNHPTAMLRSWNTTHIFQLYDGTLIAGIWAHMHWIKARFALEDIQVIPKSLRQFSRKLARSTTTLRPDGTVTSEPTLSAVHAATGNRFADFARDVTSRFGEDGIIEALLDRLGCTNGFFLDIGSFGIKQHSHVWNLAAGRRWRGRVVRVPSAAWDCGNDFVFPGVDTIDLPAIDLSQPEGFIDAVDSSLAGNSVDFLSIGVDGADYQIWQTLAHLRSRLVAIEFNPTITNDVFFVQAPNFGIHQGCSLNALIELGKEQGYELIACSRVTAFFVVRESYAAFGIVDNDIDAMYVPSVMKLYQLFDGTLRLSGMRRLISHGIELAEDEIQILPRALRLWPESVPDGPHTTLYVGEPRL